MKQPNLHTSPIYSIDSWLCKLYSPIDYAENIVLAILGYWLQYLHMSGKIGKGLKPKIDNRR